MNQKYKIVLIEPSLIVAEGIKKILEKDNNFAIVAHISTMSEFNEFHHGNADIVIINPIEIHNAKTPLQSFIPEKNNCAFIALSYGPYNESDIHQYDGVIGLFTTPEQISKRLLTAIESVNENPRADNSNELSAREREILTAVAKGMSNKEIADEFNLSIHTVVSHRKNISHKLGINSISGLTIYAIINKLIDVTDF